MVAVPGSYVLTNNIVVTSGTGIYINASKNKSGGIIDARGLGLVLNKLVADNLGYGLLVDSTSPVGYGGKGFSDNTDNVIGGFLYV